MKMFSTAHSMDPNLAVEEWVDAVRRECGAVDDDSVAPFMLAAAALPSLPFHERVVAVRVLHYWLDAVIYLEASLQGSEPEAKTSVKPSHPKRFFICWHKWCRLYVRRCHDHAAGMGVGDEYWWHARIGPVHLRTRGKYVERSWP